MCVCACVHVCVAYLFYVFYALLEIYVYEQYNGVYLDFQLIFHECISITDNINICRKMCVHHTTINGILSFALS